MIYTSYYANHRNYPVGYYPVCISRYPPKGFRGSRILELAPSADLLMDYKGGQCNDEQYIERFNLQLERLDVHEIAADVEKCVMLCYEKPGDFCHRHLVAKWLKEAGYQVEELKSKHDKLI